MEFTRRCGSVRLSKCVLVFRRRRERVSYLRDCVKVEDAARAKIVRHVLEGKLLPRLKAHRPVLRLLVLADGTLLAFGLAEGWAALARIARRTREPPLTLRRPRRREHLADSPWQEGQEDLHKDGEPGRLLGDARLGAKIVAAKVALGERDGVLVRHELLARDGELAIVFCCRVEGRAAPERLPGRARLLALGDAPHEHQQRVRLVLRHGVKQVERPLLVHRGALGELVGVRSVARVLGQVAACL
eukprot:3159498-Pleurochrysis_carterae.AAC.1